MKSPYIHIIVIIIIALVAGWLRFANLDAINFHNDEYYQLETAVGLNESGEYRRYDFYTNSLGDEYTRAKLYTWQIAQSFMFFGVNEMAARLPAVIWGTLLVVIVIITLLFSIKNYWIAYGTGLLITFDNFFIEMSRFTRMYSMVFVLTILIVFFAYKFFRSKPKGKQLIYATVIILCSVVDFLIFKELTMAIWFGIGCYVAIRGLWYLWKKEQLDKLYSFIFIIGGGLVVGLGLVHVFIQPIIPVDAFIFRDQPHFYYLTEIFSDLHIPEFGFFFLLVGLTSIKSLRSYKGFLAVISTTLLLYFVYLSHRWEAKRYIGFIIPFFYLFITIGIFTIARWLVKKIPVHKNGKIIITVIFFLMCGPWLSLPGIKADYFFIQPAYADLSYDKINRPNVKEAYEFVIDHYQAGEVVLIQGPRYFYWTDNSIPVYKLGREQELTFDEFKELTNLGQTGGWVIYNDTKKQHLVRKIKDYANENFTSYNGLEYTKVNVFHFEPEDLIEQTNEE